MPVGVITRSDKENIMSIKNRIAASELQRIRAMVNESRNYRSHPNGRDVRIQIPESAMLNAPAGSVDAMPWRTFYKHETPNSFGEPGRYFLLWGYSVEPDGSVNLSVQYKHPRESGRPHLLSVYVAADCLIAWRRA
jgi:hypothetical protein